MGEIWVFESCQGGRIWAIRRKRKDFHSLYFFFRGISAFMGYIPRNKRSRLVSSIVPTSVGVQPGGRSGGRKGLEAAKFVFSGGMTPKCKKNNHKILIFNGQKKIFYTLIRKYRP